MTVECPKCHTENTDTQKFCGECETPLLGIQEAIYTKTMETPAEELTTGSTSARRYQIKEELGPYKIVRLIGEGGRSSMSSSSSFNLSIIERLTG